MSKKPVPHPILTTPRLRLRRFRESDAAAMHVCYGDADVMRYWDTLPHTRMIESERVVRYAIDCTPAYYRSWAVADAATDDCLGLVNYHDGHIRSRRATIGYMITPARQRQGIGREAVSAVIEHCFHDLKLHRLMAVIRPLNLASRALVEGLGFRCEGTLRENTRVGEVWWDDVVYGLLADDWA